MKTEEGLTAQDIRDLSEFFARMIDEGMTSMKDLDLCHTCGKIKLSCSCVDCNCINCKEIKNEN